MKFLTGLIVFLALSGTVRAATEDAAGGKDHPLISRYAGSQLLAWRNEPFAAVKPFAMLPADLARGRKLNPDATLQGSLSELYYLAPAGRSALEVQRNYESALAAAGAQLLHACEGSQPGCFSRGGPARQLLLNAVVPLAQQARGRTSYQAFAANSLNLRLAVYRLQRGSDEFHVSVYSVDAASDAGPFAGMAATWLQIVQTAAMEGDKVSVLKASQLADSLRNEGRIALYGIYFDTGKAALKPESKAQLDEMAQLLRQNTALRVLIVGHTDNQGNYSSNMALSSQRAAAVIDALARDYQIARNRMEARGVADSAPLASNREEAGRARNRRVEMVEQ